jgi:hypothetical protein
MSPSFIEEIFAKLYGIPCWNVQQGHGSFVTFEFGTPSLRIGKVIERNPDRPGSYPRRLVHACGEWHLWIYCCGWQIAQDGNVLAANESTRECIAGACHALNGQVLSAFTCKVARGTIRFSFDLGGKLNTGPYDDELLEQWMLYCPDGYVLTYRSDGAFSYGRSDAPGGPFQQLTVAEQ